MVLTDKIIKFKHWKTKENIQKTLSRSHPFEEKTNLICPFDNTSILFVYDCLDKSYVCPNCGLEYEIKSRSQQAVNKFFKDYLINVQEELKNLKDKQQELLFILKYASK